MKRSFSPVDLVAVPRTSTSSAMALGTSMLSAARAEPALPPALVQPLERLANECDRLRTSRQHEIEARTIEPSRSVEADRELDACWASTHAFLMCCAKLGAAPEGAERAARAKAVLEWVFPDGLRFLTLPYRQQWAESLTKLDRLAQPEMVEHLRSLGGEPFVRVVEASHERYGAALHVTKCRAAAKARIKRREALEGVLGALRSYTLHVACYLDEHGGDPGARRLGLALLKPLATWESSGGGRRASAPAGEGPGGDGPAEGHDEGPGGKGPADGSGQSFQRLGGGVEKK